MNNVVERNPNSTSIPTEQHGKPQTVGKTPSNNDRDVLSDEPQSVGKEPFKIDFDKVFDSSRDETPMEIVVVSSNSGTGDGDRRRRRRKRKKLSEADGSMSNDGDTGGGGGGGGNDLAMLPDSEIKATIERTERTLADFESKLPDKGAKLKSHIQKLEEELQRRKHFRSSQQDDHGCKKPAHPDHASVNDAPEGFTRNVRSSLPPERSAFATSFMKKLEGKANHKPEENEFEGKAKPKLEEKKLEGNIILKSEQNIGDQSNSAFNDELSFLNRCDKRKRPLAPLPKRKAKSGPPCKDFSPWKPPNGFNNSETCRPFSSVGPYRQSKEKIADSCNVKDASPAQKLNGLKNDQAVVLVDEDEVEPAESKHEAEQLPTNNIEGKIYYPSRDDPESLEIFRSELKCLQPGEYLTSTIMNFYIRFLQESSSEGLLKNVYFFNTYFYNKLQEAVAYQKSDKEAFFVKFRRWWRGINLFQKAYIFLPINEDKHWSLVIICIPEGDKSGPIVLHLDSLGLHCSPAIFSNIKRLLKNERDFLNEDRGNLDIPISEHIWRNLDRRIDERIIPVPRQTNDYDCGLFVLYYMERFIEEAPDRMKKLALDTMFGRNWFKPQEASSLRGKIRKILEEKFGNALKENDAVWQPVCLTPNVEAPKS